MLTIGSINWDVYFEQARCILKEAGIQININEGTKGLHGNSKQVFIERFPVKGNKAAIEALEALADFNGSKYVTYGVYWYSGHFSFIN